MAKKLLKAILPTKPKSIIPKRKSILSELGLKRKKSDLQKLYILSQKLLFGTRKLPKKRKKRPISKKRKPIRGKLIKTPKIIKTSTRTIRGQSRAIKDAKSTPRPRPQIIKPPIKRQILTSSNSVLWIKMSSTGIKELKSAKDFDFRFHKIMLSDIATAMTDLRLALQTKAAQIIGWHVPRETGDLQESLLGSLSKEASITPPMFPRNNKQLELRIGYYSDIPYLEYVNKPKRDIFVRHHRSMGQIGRRSRKLLHDPHAKTLFMLTTKEAIKAEARRLTYKMIKTLGLKWKYPTTTVKSFFKYTGYNFR